MQRNKIKLFSRQVFITDEVKDIVPEFLMLLHGVIDSPDIPLNVSRSFLQADSNVKKINSYITRKVADKLSELFKKDRKAYEEKWSDIGLFVKYGMISEEKVYDVLVMNSTIDNHFISQLEHKLDKVALKRVDSDVIDKLIPKSDAGSHSLTPEESNKLKEIFDKAINNPSMKVEIESLDKDELPVTVTMDEWMRRMKDMARLGGGGMNFYGSMPDSYKVSINGNHKLVDRILKTENPDEQSILAKQAFDLALLSQGMLKGAELTAFVTRSV